MPEQPTTAHDAVCDAVLQWSWDRRGTVGEAVLAALGIPADATANEVKAGVAFLRMCRDSFHNEIVKTVNPNDPQQEDERPWWEAMSHMRYAYGLSPEAAVLALHDRLTGRADG